MSAHMYVLYKEELFINVQIFSFFFVSFLILSRTYWHCVVFPMNTMEIYTETSGPNKSIEYRVLDTDLELEAKRKTNY